MTADYNLYFGNGTDEVGVVSGGNTLVGDPLFANAAAGDFRLSEGSAGEDNGLDVGVTEDLLGLPWPLGAGVERGAYEIDPGPTAFDAHRSV